MATRTEVWAGLDHGAATSDREPEGRRLARAPTVDLEGDPIAVDDARTARGRGGAARPVSRGRRGRRRERGGFPRSRSRRTAGRPPGRRPSPGCATCRPSAIRGWTWRKPERSRRTRIACMRLVCSTSKSVTAEPSGATMRKARSELACRGERRSSAARGRSRPRRARARPDRAASAHCAVARRRRPRRRAAPRTPPVRRASRHRTRARARQGTLTMRTGALTPPRTRPRRSRREHRRRRTRP